MTAFTYWCKAVEYFSKQVMWSKCRGVNKQLLSTPKLWEKEDLEQSLYTSQFPGRGQGRKLIEKVHVLNLHQMYMIMYVLLT